jgi:phytoene dehydrogenase-like protein
MAGLAAGATAAAAGASTLVLDSHPIGGRARCTERDGFTFNMGAHALYAGGPGMDVLRSLGITPVGARPPLSRYRARYRGELHLLPTSPTSVARTRIFGTRAKAQFSRLMLSIPRLDPTRVAGQSAAAWIAGHDLRPDVADVVRGLVRISTYAPDFDQLSADAAVSQLQSAAKRGVLYLDGGWQPLIDGLAALVAGRVRAGSAVERVEPMTGGRVEVTCADGQTIVARAVVVAPGTPAATRALLPADPGWGDVGEPVTAACLDVGVGRVPSPGYVLGIDDPVYATTQSPPARQAPEGCAVVSVLRYGARTADADRADMETFLAAAGVADEDVMTRRFLARMVVTGAGPRPSTGGLAGRPPVVVHGLPGVFVAGDWVGPTGLLADASLASGQAAARAALRVVGRSTTMVA